MKSLLLSLWAVGLLAAATPSPLESARDLQDRAALEKLANDSLDAASKAPADAAAQYRCGAGIVVPCRKSRSSCTIKKAARGAAERGIKAAEKAVALKPEAESYRVLATLYGPGDHRHYERLELRTEGQRRQSTRPSRRLPEFFGGVCRSGRWETTTCQPSWAAEQRARFPIFKRRSSSTRRMRRPTCGSGSACVRRSRMTRHARHLPSRSPFESQCAFG